VLAPGQQRTPRACARSGLEKRSRQNHYSFARITAALKMKVEDLRPRGAGWTVQLHEKGGEEHVMPCHHALAEALRAYIDAAGIAEDRKGWLFRPAPGHRARSRDAQVGDDAEQPRPRALEARGTGERDGASGGGD
jgi:integrase